MIEHSLTTAQVLYLSLIAATGLTGYWQLWQAFVGVSRFTPETRRRLATTGQFILLICSICLAVLYSSENIQMELDRMSTTGVILCLLAGPPLVSPVLFVAARVMITSDSNT